MKEPQHSVGEIKHRYFVYLFITRMSMLYTHMWPLPTPAGPHVTPTNPCRPTCDPYPPLQVHMLPLPIPLGEIKHWYFIYLFITNMSTLYTPASLYVTLPTPSGPHVTPYPLLQAHMWPLPTPAGPHVTPTHPCRSTCYPYPSLQVHICDNYPSTFKEHYSLPQWS